MQQKTSPFNNTVPVFKKHSDLSLRQFSKATWVVSQISGVLFFFPPIAESLPNNTQPYKRLKTREHWSLVEVVEIYDRNISESLPTTGTLELGNAGTGTWQREMKYYILKQQL